MALHRRIPKKNRKKLKSVDPFNTKANAVKFQDTNKNKNSAPTNLKDEQPLTKSMKNLMAEVVTKEDAKKKKKQKNAVLKQAEELGLKKGKFETVNRFVRRIEGTLHSRINEQMAIAKHGMAGRKQEEIDADYAKIDEAEKRKKDQEKREIDNKIKEAKKKREAEAKKREEAEKAKEQRKAEKRKMKEEEEKEESFDEEEDDDEDDERKEKKGKKDDKEPDSKKAKLSKKERRKETLKARKTDEQKRRAGEALINSREVIEFGERYDAPPTFGGALKKKFEPLMAKAGQKTLLLHSMLQKGGQKTEYLDNSKKIQEERQRVIDAYRDIKKQKSIAARAASGNGNGNGNPLSE